MVAAKCYNHSEGEKSMHWKAKQPTTIIMILTLYLGGCTTPQDFTDPVEQTSDKETIQDSETEPVDGGITDDFFHQWDTAPARTRDRVWTSPPPPLPALGVGGFLLPHERVFSILKAGGGVGIVHVRSGSRTTVLTILRFGV